MAERIEMLGYEHRIDRAMIRELVGANCPESGIDALLRERIVERPDGQGPDRAKVRAGGVSVWAIVVDLDATSSIEQVMGDFDLQAEDVRAAALYYLRHPDLIEARIALNRAPYTS